MNISSLPVHLADIGTRPVQAFLRFGHTDLRGLVVADAVVIHSKPGVVADHSSRDERLLQFERQAPGAIFTKRESQVAELALSRFATNAHDLFQRGSKPAARRDLHRVRTVEPV